ncbi:hypothetical protein [Campylobacter sp. MIT 97-5078]|uniref:hypothetical protein n=1 Tax=Campylobacter sp. MIT 97-5078 TaxID=1548153 RepID=UPI0005142BCF|nr:hypothetical protein [Campylobacter sp. MIT 97-5078]KGI56488.1 hypothetical protein LR59_07205 [Campylobacter sp. MIT 97-5078]TQR27992.1 hypothetical protein DMB91_01805 [Campylobacter sp. MIT 97-5078]
MKKAFSLFECLLVLVLSCAFAFIIFQPLQNLFSLYSSQQSQKALELHSSFTFIEKLLRRCIKLQISSQNISCLLEDKNNILLQRSLHTFIGSSGLLLQDQNKSFYAPKSHFIHEIVSNNKKIQVGVLAQQLALRNQKNHFLYLYNLETKQIYELEVLSDTELKFSQNTEFKGFYKLVEANILISFQQNSLSYEYTAYSSTKSQKAILLEEVQSFAISQNASTYTMKICLFDKTKPICLEKELLL